MRRIVLSGILAVALSLVACSDQPTEVTPSSPEQLPQASAVTGCPVTPTAGDILTLVNELLPRGPIRTSVILFVNTLPPRLQDRIKMAVRRRIFPIVDLILRSFYAGRLKNGTSDETFAKTLDLIKALHCYVGITPPDLPTTTTGADVVVGVALPNVPFTFCTPTTRGSISGSRDAVTPAMGGVTIVIRNLPDEPPPLRTSLNQYPYFYHFSGVTAAGPVEFNVPVTAALALKEGSFEGNFDVLRLAHNVGPDFGDVEILPRPGPAELPACPTVGAIRAAESGHFGWAKKLFFPAELQAASAAQVPIDLQRVGGRTRNFSDFGIVDPGSNPADLNFNGDFSELSAPAGTAVSPAPSVVVRSMNGTPIPNVPVDFAVGEGGGTVNGGSTATVTTGDDGVATVNSWVLGEETGTYTLTATPLDLNATAGPPPHPPVKFAPASIEFTATVPSVAQFGFEDGEPDWATTGFWNRSTLTGITNVTFGALPAPFAGSYALWYGRPATGDFLSPLGGPNSGNAVSPSFTMPTGSDVTLEFKTWWEIEGVSPTFFDIMSVELEVTTPAGTSILALSRLNPTSGGGGSASQVYSTAGFNLPPIWVTSSIPIPVDIQGETVRIRFSFNTGDALYNNMRGWIVDQVAVRVGGGPGLRLGALAPSISEELVPADQMTFPVRSEEP